MIGVGLPSQDPVARRAAWSASSEPSISGMLRSVSRSSIRWLSERTAKASPPLPAVTAALPKILGRWDAQAGSSLQRHHSFLPRYRCGTAFVLAT
jgi:hypothetical protein